MVSYLVTGASRGIGFGLLQKLSNDPSNIVVGLVRNKAATDEKVAKELPGRKNVLIIKGDLSDFSSMKNAVPEVSKATGGSLDIIIANAALVSEWSAYDPIGELGKDPVALEKDLLESFNVNTIGNIHLFNLFLPLIQKGALKKVVAISSGMAEVDLISEFEIDSAAPYSISKAATNAAVAKFHAQYKKENILFMSISPGYVDTGSADNISEENLKKVAGMAAKFAKYAPHFKGAMTIEESVQAILSVIENATIAKNGGLMVSHLGTKQWL